MQAFKTKGFKNKYKLVMYVSMLKEREMWTSNKQAYAATQWSMYVIAWFWILRRMEDIKNINLFSIKYNRTSSSFK